jgi:hypothetical protein
VSALTLRAPLALLALAALLAAAPAAAGGGLGVTLGALGGTSLPDPRLGDYQWNTSARAAWGAQALLERGRFATGARLWCSSTTQTMDLPSGPITPRVGLTRLELVGASRVLAFGGAELHLIGSAGWLHLAYHPDQVDITPGPGSVRLAPVDEWIGGAGVALRRPLGERWSLGLEVEREFFGLDAAHRSGSAIVYSRESLGEWGARLELAKRFSIG